MNTLTLDEWMRKRTLRNSTLYEAGAADAWDARQPEIDALKARIAELERDAARYRWLSERANRLTVGFDREGKSVAKISLAIAYPFYQTKTCAERLGQAIDEAMKGK